MIRVTIEMVPSGIEEAKYPMHVIEIWNDLQGTLKNQRKGNYGYRISRKISRQQIGQHSYGWHKEGKIENFPRAAKNSVHLLLAILKDAYE